MADPTRMRVRGQRAELRDQEMSQGRLMLTDHSIVAMQGEDFFGIVLQRLQHEGQNSIITNSIAGYGNGSGSFLHLRQGLNQRYGGDRRPGAVSIIGALTRMSTQMPSRTVLTTSTESIRACLMLNVSSLAFSTVRGKTTGTKSAS